MREPLTLAVAQPQCIPYDVAANALTHAAAIRSAAARVVVFPELSLTGYELDAAAISSADPRLRPIVDACTETGSVALVGAPVPGDGDRTHLAMVKIDGSGASVAYRKLWLGDSETPRFTSGSAPAVIDVDGWRLGLAICKDTAIPEHAADTASLGINVYVAGTLMAAGEAQIQAERGRRIAITHQVWVAFASFAGATGDGYDHAAGRSSIWAPDGSLAAHCGPAVDLLARANLEPTSAR